MPICIRRGVLPCVVTRPKLALVMPLVALPHRTRFRTLNTSPRRSNERRSVKRKVRPNETFLLRFHGVRSFGLLRVALPNCESSVACVIPWLKTLLLYQRSLAGSNVAPDGVARQFSYDVMNTRLPAPMGLAPDATVSGTPDS